MIKKYIPRTVDAQVDEFLMYSGAVLIEGAKGCGKTRTAIERSKSTVFMHDPQKSESYLRLAATKPSILLEGETPRLIDEWQLAPNLWNGVKFLVDMRGEPGQFILTGSTSLPPDDKRHSGAGRFSRILMRPMSLFESGESNGIVSVGKLFETGSEIEGSSGLSLENMIGSLIRGGWPQIIGESRKYASSFMKNYVDTIVNVDVSDVDGIKRNPSSVLHLMRSLSRNVSSTANLTTIRKDMMGEEDTTERTISAYINALRRIHIVEDLPAWNPSLRSSVAVRTSPKRHFVDPSIATAVLRADVGDLIMDFNTLGLLFESLCIRDLRVYAQANDGDVFHYRDGNDLEVDAIIHLKNGMWGAIEIKLGTDEIGKASRNLIRLRDSINTEKMRLPSFLMVLTAGDYAYRQDDGVLVVPIGCLRD